MHWSQVSVTSSSLRVKLTEHTSLSYMEQRLITAKLLWHNDVAMTSDESWAEWDPKNDHENMQVFTNWIKAPLNVRLSPRKA